jgi:hypothetical protein
MAIQSATQIVKSTKVVAARYEGVSYNILILANVLSNMAGVEIRWSMFYFPKDVSGLNV